MQHEHQQTVRVPSDTLEELVHRPSSVEQTGRVRPNARSNCTLHCTQKLCIYSHEGHTLGLSKFGGLRVYMYFLATCICRMI